MVLWLFAGACVGVGQSSFVEWEGYLPSSLRGLVTCTCINRVFHGMGRLDDAYLVRLS
jgi:hypothetical protein